MSGEEIVVIGERTIRRSPRLHQQQEVGTMLLGSEVERVAEIGVGP